MALDYEARIGDLVLIHDPRLADQLGREGQLGVVVNTRKGGGRVLFLPGRESYWIEQHRLIPAPDPGALGPSSSVCLAKALSALAPEEAEVEHLDPDGLEVHVMVLNFDAARANTLAKRLGEELASWSIVPYGMAAITLVLRLRPRAG